MELFVEYVLPHLYEAVTVIAIMGYAPQIMRLIKLDTCPKEISVGSWLIWMVTYVVSMFYGHYYLNDWRFMMLTAVNMVACFVIIGLILYKSKKHG